MEFKKVARFLVSIVICFLAGAIGSFFTASEISGWYAGLNKPNFNPPNWIFGPVWTTLYFLMGIAFYLIWNKNFEPSVKFLGKQKVWNKWSAKFLNEWQKWNVILIFAVQLSLNTLWSIIFFGLHSPGIAFFELLMLWFAVLFTIINFYKISKIAAILLVPYIIWISFAGILNYFIWILN